MRYIRDFIPNKFQISMSQTLQEKDLLADIEGADQLLEDSLAPWVT